MVDIEYENSNKYFDEDYNEYRVKCKNYKLCNNASDYHFKYICMSCDIFGWGQLEFKNSQECIICYNHNILVKFPTNCGHYFCTKCTRDILYWDEQRYHLNPVNFGCLPCPNSCVNPSRGKQCGCDEYYNTIDKWEEEFPEQYNEYNNAEIESIDIGEPSGSYYTSKTCPLCRSKYN